MDDWDNKGENPSRLEQDLLDNFKTNVVGNIHLVNLFMPLIYKDHVKKVIAMSTGAAEVEFTANYDFDYGAPYAISKAAMNITMAKFSAQYAKDGVLFLSFCPGSVASGNDTNCEFLHTASPCVMWRYEI